MGPEVNIIILIRDLLLYEVRKLNIFMKRNFSSKKKKVWSEE